MTLTEVILARASKKQKVSPGDIVEAPIDQVLIHERLGPGVFQKFEKLNKPIWDPEKIAIFADHSFPPIDMVSARLLSATYGFAKKHGIKHFYPGQGVCHQLLPEKGLVVPGTVVVGADSHTTTHGAFGAFATGIGTTETAWVLAEGKLWFRVPETIHVNIEGTPRPGVMAKDVTLLILKRIGTAGANYKAIEFGGSYVDDLSMDERMVLTNMALEMGAKNAIINPDQTTWDFLEKRDIPREDFPGSNSNPRDKWQIEINVSDMESLAACPHSPDNVKPVRELGEVQVNRVFIGSCTGGRLNDLRIAAEILKGRKIAEGLLLLVIPASNEIYVEALKEGILEALIESGATIGNSSCGPCGGISIGVLHDTDVCVTASSRNFRGRMGSLESQVYLSSPATAAATALTGKISDPQSFLRKED
jgi:homoaconitate hydratase family protein